MSDEAFLIVWLRLGVVAALLAVGGYGVYWGARSGVLEYRCEHEGRLADGTVVRRYRVGLQRDPRMFFHAHPDDDRVEYAFRTADGDSVPGDASISRNLWESLHVGSRVTVRYVPARPALNRIDGEPIPMAEAVTAAVVGVAVLSPLAFVGWSLVRMRATGRRRRAIASATIAQRRRRR